MNKKHSILMTIFFIFIILLASTSYFSSIEKRVYINEFTFNNDSNNSCYISFGHDDFLNSVSDNGIFRCNEWLYYFDEIQIRNVGSNEESMVKYYNRHNDRKRIILIINTEDLSKIIRDIKRN